MSPYWIGFFEHLRSCGRNGGIFIAALGGFFGVVIVAIIFRNEGIEVDPAAVVTGCAVLLSVWIVLSVRRIRMARTRLRFPRLSDDELRVARERLKNSNRGRSPGGSPAG